jgi:transcriptional regulator with XRE-family HTH domain
MGEERTPSMEHIERQRPEFYAALGRTIQVLRTDQGLDRKDLADRAGISYSYLAAIENGKKPPSSRVLFDIAGALGLHSHELLASVETRFQRHLAQAPTELRLEAPSRRRVWFHAEAPPAGDRQEGARAASWAIGAHPPGPTPYSPTGFLMEIDRLSRELTDQDRELVLGLARRLAGRED